MHRFLYNGHSDLMWFLSLPTVFKYTLLLLSGMALIACQPHQDLKQKEQLKFEKSKINESTTALSVVDSSGYSVRVNRSAQRVVCLFESGCDGLYMLNQGDKIVGIPAVIYQQPELYHAYSILDPRIKAKQIATPSQGSNATNLESLLLLQPDLVIMGGAEKQTITILRQLNIPVYIMQSETYTQTKKELTDIALLLGAVTRAKKILDYSDAKIAEIQRDIKKTGNRQTIYYAWSSGRIFSTSGTKSNTNEFIELAGAKNVVKTETNQPNVNPETLIEWNPDNIVLWNTNPQLIYQRPELRLLKAVKQKRVFNLSPAFIYNPHTIKIMLTALSLHQHIYADSPAYAMKKNQYEVLNMLYGSTAAQALLAP